MRDDTGARIVLEIIGPGELFGELSLLDGGSRTASAVVIEELEALHVDRGDLNHFLHVQPAAALDLLGAMAKRMRRTVELLRHTASRNVNLEMEDKRSGVQKAADWIAEFSGSIPFLMIHIVIFALWILLNLKAIPFAPMFDPFPYGLLTMVVSLEAIILSSSCCSAKTGKVARTASGATWVRDQLEGRARDRPHAREDGPADLRKRPPAGEDRARPERPLSSEPMR